MVWGVGIKTLFGEDICPIRVSKSRGQRDSITGIEVNFRPIPAIFSAFYRVNCLSCDFTGLTKFVLEKHTS